MKCLFMKFTLRSGARGRKGVPLVFRSQRERPLLTASRGQGKDVSPRRWYFKQGSQRLRGFQADLILGKLEGSATQWLKAT